MTPPLHAIPRIDIPLTLPKPRLVAHARRMTELARQYTAALPGIPGRDLPAFAGVIPLGTALSWAADLRIIPASGPAVRLAAWPGSVDAKQMRDTLAADAPRYRPPTHTGRCPVPGSRGGKCNERGRTRTRWVVDPESGVWEWREMCDMHLPQAEQRLADAPAPAPNRGGVLTAVFPERNISVWYAWALPGWQESGHVETGPPAVPCRPDLRLVQTEEAQ